MLSMARSTCACCAGPWTWVGSTKSSLSVTCRSCVNWRTTSFRSVVALWGWAITKQFLLNEAESQEVLFNRVAMLVELE